MESHTSPKTFTDDRVPPSDSTQSSQIPPPASSPQTVNPVILLAAGLIGALIFWEAAELFAQSFSFKPSAKAAGEPYAFAQLNKEQARANSLNSGVAYGLMGMGLALSLGLAALSVKPRSLLQVASGSLVGVFLGVVLPFALCLVLVPVHYPMERDPEEVNLGKIIAIHATTWGAAGFAGGLAFGLASASSSVFFNTLKRGLAFAVGGTVAAMIAAAIYEVVAMVALSGETTFNIPDRWTARLLAWSLVGLGTAIGVLCIARSTPPMSQKPTVSLD